MAPSIEVGRPGLMTRRSATAAELQLAKKRMAEITALLERVEQEGLRFNNEMLGVHTPSYLGTPSAQPSPVPPSMRQPSDVNVPKIVVTAPPTYEVPPYTPALHHNGRNPVWLWRKLMQWLCVCSDGADDMIL